VTLPKLGELTEENVLAMHIAKSAIYTFQNPLLVGGILAGLPDEALKILENYAEKGGVAFQLKDDILGMFGDSEKTGKSANSDLVQGKSTLLVAKTLELGNEKQKKDLGKAWGVKKAKEEDIKRAKEAIKESGSLDYSIKKIKSLATEAIEMAESLGKLNLNRQAIDYLKGIADYTINRDL
jgi:geranylgeranyl diphosphate synthase type I